MFGYGILFLIDVAFIIHTVKTGRFWPWAYVILLIPGLGTAAYVVFEILPEYRYSPQARKAQASVSARINPTQRYRALLAELETVDTLGNRLALAQECLRLKRYDEALHHYESIIALPMGDEPIYYLGKAQAEFGLGQPQMAIATLDELKRHWPNYQSQDGHLLYAKSLEACGRDADALAEYDALARYFAGQEVQLRRLLLLDRLGQPGEAEAIAAEMMRYYKKAPRHARHQQAEWFSGARAYLKARPHPRAAPEARAETA